MSCVRTIAAHAARDLGLLMMLVATVAIGAERKEATPVSLAPLPEAVSSFGGAIVGDWLYVYSGHTGEAHAHSKKNLSQKFQRLSLVKGAAWEQLPAGPGLQGLPMVGYGNNVYRIGGLSALNEPGEKEKLVSITEFAAFDPAQGKWSQLAALPEGRSSHDAAVLGDTLYVVGGWNLGSERGWHKSALSIDLKDPKATWKELPAPPFQRRALAVAAHQGRIYAIGGMTPEGPSNEVNYFDVSKQTWHSGPVLSSKPMMGFGSSAFALGGKLYATTMDGTINRLSDDGKEWQSAGKLQEARFFHRMIPYGNAMIVVAGASHGVGHLDSIERFTPEASSPAKATVQAGGQP